MSSSGTFEKQIKSIVSQVRQASGWILRVFSSRSRQLMLQLFKSMVIPIAEYGCQLWSPMSIGQIRKIEGLQRSFTHRIEGMGNINYWERLQELQLYSLERRRERYFIIYIWKIVNGLAPNIDIDGVSISIYRNIRRGLLCRIPSLNNRARARIQTMKENSLVVHGARLFNAMPSEIRESRSELETFKKKLDGFLKTMPDKPALP